MLPSEYFTISQLFPPGGQSIGDSASASVLPMNIQDGFPLGLTGLISLQSKDSQESSPTPQFKIINSLARSLLYNPTLTSIHKYWENHSFDYMDLCWESNVSVFYMLCRFVIAFFPISKCLLTSWLQSPSAVIFEPKKIKPVTVSIFTSDICHEVMGPEAMILLFEF